VRRGERGQRREEGWREERGERRNEKGEEFKEVGDVLGQLARCCRWFPRDAFGRADNADIAIR